MENDDDDDRDRSISTTLQKYLHGLTVGSGKGGGEGGEKHLGCARGEYAFRIIV